MGKAKRFNEYDGAVAERRKVVQNYGYTRQGLSVGSSFRGMPQSPPIATVLSTDAGTGTGTFCSASLSADQTTSIAATNHIEFDTLDEDGGITLQTGAGQLDGIFELSAGKKYYLSGGVRPEFSGATGQLVVAWYDITNAAEIGRRAIYESQTHASNNANQPKAEVTFTPTVNVTVELRIIAVTALTALATEYCQATIFEIALGGSSGGGSGGGSSVSFPIEPAITDNSDTWTGTQTLNLATGDGHIYKWTVDQALTFAAAVTNIPASGTQRTFELEFEHDGVGGTFTVTLPNNFVDENGNTLASFDISANTVLLSCRVNNGTDFLVVQKNVTAVTAGSEAPFSDADPLVKGSADATKLLRFEVDGFTTATTRTITVPDSTTTMAGLGVTSQTWTGTNVFAGNTEVRTSNFSIQNTADPTKEIQFGLALATTGTVMSIVSNHTANRILTLPDTTTDLAGLGTLSQTWTGTNIFAGNTDVRDSNFSVQNTADNTKEARFDSSGITTGTVRTFTLPDSTTSLAGLGVTSQQWTGTNDFFGITLLKDGASYELRNGTDITKVVQWDLSAITTATTRTITMPDADVNLGSLTGSFSDSDFDVHDNTDVTKIAKFECSAITTGQTRTYTFPDVSGGIETVSSISFPSNKTFKDNTCGFADSADLTKILLFDCSGITTATTRTLTVPDSTTTIAGLGVVSQTWTGTNIWAGVSTFNGNVTIGDAATDTLTVTADIASDLIPNDGTRDLGDSVSGWNNIYSDNTLFCSNLKVWTDDSDINVFDDLDMQAGGTVDFADTATTAGTSTQTLPAQPDGFIIIKVNGASKRVPYYVP